METTMSDAERAGRRKLAEMLSDPNMSLTMCLGGAIALTQVCGTLAEKGAANAADAAIAAYFGAVH